MMKHNLKQIHQFEVTQLADLDAVVFDIIQLLGGPGLVLFKGEMGAGKTSLISKICHQLGVKDTISSPTFALVNIYLDQENQCLYHLDLYRLDSADEFLEAGMEEYLNHDHWTFIEWPELAIPFIDQPFSLIQIQLSEAGKRIINISQN